MERIAAVAVLGKRKQETGIAATDAKHATYHITKSVSLSSFFNPNVEKATCQAVHGARRPAAAAAAPGASIVKSDVAACSCLIHLVDSVLS